MKKYVYLLILRLISVNFTILKKQFEVSFGRKGYKYFIGYKDDDYKIKLLCIMLPKVSGYLKSFD